MAAVNPFRELEGVPGVYTTGRTLLTVNAAPGTSVYGERLVEFGGLQYRAWDAGRSKLAAMILLGARGFGLERSSDVLYLGAASGTTSSHVSDIVTEGRVYCVEVSQRSFRDLVKVCETRRNMIPIMADASRPEEYAHVVESVDFVYQDIAQRNQVDVFVRNMRHFEARRGVLMLKSRSVDVSRPPKDVYAEAREELTAGGWNVRQILDLDRHAKDHAALVVDSEPFAYVLAFAGDRFVMVRHRERAWEMPGGRLRKGEDFEQAALREFSEETGMRLRIISGRPMGGGMVFAGLAEGEPRRGPSGEVLEAGLFSELPGKLSFPLVEYSQMLAWAKAAVETFKRGKGIDGSCFATEQTRCSE